MDSFKEKVSEAKFGKSEKVFAWQHDNYVYYPKNRNWYIVSFLVLIFAVAWTIWVENYFFGAFLVLFYFLIILLDHRPPEAVEFVITPAGIKSGNNFYFWREISDFYIVYQPGGLKNLYFEFNNILNGRLVIPLNDQDPIAIRNFLLKYIKEDFDREVEPISERLRRYLKL